MKETNVNLSSRDFRKVEKNYNDNDAGIGSNLLCSYVFKEVFAMGF